jgi:hypothetical protein
MRFELRGVGAKITDAMRRVAPKWAHRFVQREDHLEEQYDKGEQLKLLVASRGWKLVEEYMDDRRSTAQAALENASNLTQEKALEFAGMQGRVKELRQLNEWIEHCIKRGAEAAKVLAERKQK